MNTPEPAREIDMLLDRIVAAINGIYLLDEAALDAMAWQAKKCKRTDPGDARMVLALIADIRQDGKAAGFTAMPHRRAKFEQEHHIPVRAHRRRRS